MSSYFSRLWLTDQDVRCHNFHRDKCIILCVQVTPQLRGRNPRWNDRQAREQLQLYQSNCVIFFFPPCSHLVQTTSFDIHAYKASFFSKGESERERKRRKSLVHITAWVKGIGFSYAFQLHTLFKIYDFRTY